MSDLKPPSNPAVANIKRNRSPSVSTFLGQVTAGGVNSPQHPGARRPSNAGPETGSTGARAQSDDKDVNAFLNNIG